ncbi:MAG: molecular chaperone TorD family protein [Dehalococcoidia bacterium]|nr:molecular chaperone TorD family protein [Dehalococcoidia bacterium]
MAKSTSTTAESSAVTLRRAMAYDLLAHAMAYPDQQSFEGMKQVATAAAPSFAGTPLEDLVNRVLTAERQQLEAEHIRLFTLSSSPDCPTFETAYLSTDPSQQTARMADIAGFYRAFGVDPAQPGFRPDDVSVELAFMGYLCKKQNHATEHMGAPRVAQVRRAQRMFIREHLGRWGSALGRRITARAMSTPFYFLAGEALTDWIEADIAFLDAGPIAYAEEPQMTWDPPGTANDDMSDDIESEATEPQLIAPDDIPVLSR